MSKFQFYMNVDGKDKDNYIALCRIRSMDSDCWFVFPEEYHKLSNHEELAKMAPIKSVVSVLKTRGQYRNVNISLPDTVKKLYVDEDNNFIFKNHLLGEARLASQTSTSTSSESRFDELVSCLSQPRPESTKDILKRFLVDKFSPKNRNVEAWCDLFQKESARFNLCSQKQIEVLKSCLDPSMSDWFSINQRRLPSDAAWSSWKYQLLSTFSDHSWRPIRYVYNFKFLNGSLIDYAVKKERMLLELDRDLPDLIILDLIVVGLPSHIQNTLNRHSVNSIEKLHNKFKKFDGEDKILDASSKQEFSNKSSNSNNFSRNVNFNPSKFQEDKQKWKNAGSVNFVERKGSGGTPRKPCGICVSKGFPDRYHLEASCWYKEKPSQNVKSVNNVEAESSSLSSNEESKN